MGTLYVNSSKGKAGRTLATAARSSVGPIVSNGDGTVRAGRDAGNSRILLLGDSLGVQHIRTGMYRTGSGMAGTARWGASHDTPTGASTIRWYPATQELSWQGPGDTEGARVRVTYPRTVRLYSGNGTWWFLISAIPARMPGTDASVTATIAYYDANLAPSGWYGAVPVVGTNQGHLETMIRAATRNGVEIVNRSVGGLALPDLPALLQGLLSDPTEASSLTGIDRVVLEIGTNDMLGNGGADPSTWMSLLSTAIGLAQRIAPVTVIAPPMPSLGTAQLQENAWKYLWKPLRSTCRQAGAKCVSIWRGTFGTSASTPETGMVPDSAHPSSQAVWAALPDLVGSEFASSLYTYQPFEADLYNAGTNPTGNICGTATPSGTGGTAGTGGVATALYTNHAVERISGSNAIITATQEELSDLGPVWQKLTMSDQTVDTERVRCSRTIGSLSLPEGTILDGLFELYIPKQKGLRRVAIRVGNGSGSGMVSVWDNETQGATASDMPEQEYRMVVPVDGFVVPAGMTSLIYQIIMQARVGFTPCVYFRSISIRPRA